MKRLDPKTPIIFRGAKIASYGGFVGISNELNIYDADVLLARPSELTDKQRKIIATHMIGLWSKFGGLE